VIVHAGYALQKLDPEEADRTLALFAEMRAINAAEDNKI
jgi:hydrogenase expression/formation protein HypC